jgi:hypothetical protein
MKQMLIFIMFASILCWLMFAPIYKHVIITRQAILQKEVDYLLEVGASGRYGYIDQLMMDQSKKRLETFGFRADELQYVVTTTNGEDGMNARQPLLRGEGIGLQISYPYERLFVIDQLMGLTIPASTDRMAVKGLKMSEYVP